jgi:hypothetical protein
LAAEVLIFSFIGSRGGGPDWANFGPLGDCLLLAAFENYRNGPHFGTFWAMYILGDFFHKLKLVSKFRVFVFLLLWTIFFRSDAIFRRFFSADDAIFRRFFRR